VGKLAASGKPLSSLSADDFRAASGAFGRDVHGVFDVHGIFDVRAALRRRPATGAPSPENIERQMARWRRLLAFE
jgi:argininosuccinate lyase